MNLHKKDIVVSSSFRPDRAYVVGAQFGPHFILVGGDAGEALEEFHARYGILVEPDDPDLADIGGLEHALDEGEVVFANGFRWADHYVWLREFHGKDACSRAGRFYRTGLT